MFWVTLRHKIKNIFSRIAESFENDGDLPLKKLLGVTQLRLFLLTKKAVTILFLYLIAVTIFFFIGNYQEFIDENLIIIINSGSIAAIFLIFFCIISIVETVLCIIATTRIKTLTKKPIQDLIYYAFYLIRIFIFLIIGMALLTFYHTLFILCQGVK